MKLEDQVISLELAQRLKELGVEQESLFLWGTYRNDKSALPRVYQTRTFNGALVRATFYTSLCSAFTVAELGEILGGVSEENLTRAYGHVFNVPDTRFITARGLQECMTRPDLGAKMLIYLIENKLITL